MRRFIVENIVLLAVALAACFIARAGDPGLAMFVLAAYAAVLVGLSQRERLKKEDETAALRRRLADMTARKQRVEEALVGAAIQALWVSRIVETADAVSYVIETPLNGRLIITLPNEEETDADAAPAPAAKG